MAALPSRTRPCLNAPSAKEPQTTCRTNHLAAMASLLVLAAIGFGLIRLLGVP
jgi:hypothetical protein